MASYHINYLSRTGDLDNLWLTDVLSLIYKNKDRNWEITFDSNTWRKSISLIYQDVTIDKVRQKGYLLTIPFEVNLKKNETVFWSNQDEIRAKIIPVLLKLGFKEKEETPIILDPTSDDLFKDEFDDFDSSSEETRKLGTLELLKKIFDNKSIKVFWPVNQGYDKISNEFENKTSVLPEGVKTVHYHHTLSWPGILTPVKSQAVTGFRISSSSFNVVAKCTQELVVETEDGRFIPAKQYRDKVIIGNGKLRVSRLTLTNVNDSLYHELVANWATLTESETKAINTYDLHLWGWSEEEFLWDLVGENVKSVSVDELVTLIESISKLEVKQTVYNRKLKEAKALLSSWTYHPNEGYVPETEEFGIKWWVYNPKIEENQQTALMFEKDPVDQIDISIVKFPKTALEKVYQEEVNAIEIKTWWDIEKLEKTIEGIKKELEEKRSTLSIISYKYFLNWFSSELEYSSSWQEATKAQGIVWGVKNVNTITSSQGVIAKIALFKKQ